MEYRQPEGEGSRVREVSVDCRFSPRQMQVLRELLFGASEKQVAYRLGLSRHTVHEHVKQIYKRMTVCSRGELLARFLQDLNLEALIMPQRRAG